MQRMLMDAVLVSWSTARADDLQPVTLEEAVAAIASAPAAQIDGHEIVAADARVDAAGAWPSPSVHVQTNRLTAQLVAGASVPLPVFGTVSATRHQADAESQVVRAEAELHRRELRRRVVTAWIALARADGDVIATSIAGLQAAELELIAKGRLDAGMGADVDVTVARAAKARAEVAAAAAVRTQHAASAELAGILGWDPTKRLRSDGEPLTGTAVELAALRARLATHPERAAAQRRIAVAEAAVDQVQTLRWPSLAVEAQVSFSDPTTPGTDAMIGIVLDVPVFSRIGDRTRAARAAAAAERARLVVTETELGAGLVAAYERWEAAAEKLTGLQRDVVPAQERAAALSAQAFREGARDLASALVAERDLATVRAEVNGARADAANAWADLQTASGEVAGR